MFKKLKLLALFLFLSSAAFAQGVRVGDSSPVWIVSSPNGGQVFAIPGAVINFCNAPANAVPCTNKAQTYTDSTLTTQCPLTSQVVLQGTNTCATSTDLFGNWGAWVASG